MGLDSHSGFVPRTAELRLPWDRLWARQEFLRAIQRQEPEALVNLHTRVFLPKGRRVIKSLSGDKAWQSDFEVRERAVVPLQADIREWAGRYHLDGPPGKAQTDAVLAFGRWLDDALLDTFAAWAKGEDDDPPGWAFPSFHSGFMLMEEEPPIITVRLPGWSAQQETKKAFLKRAGQEFKKVITKHILKRPKKSLGTESVNPRLPRRHFDALVLFQVRRLKHAVIAEKLDCALNSVSTGIHEAAKEVIGPDYSSWLMPTSKAGRKPRKGGSTG